MKVWNMIDMRINRSVKLVWVLIFMLGFSGCIVPYEAMIDEDRDLIAIDGSLVKGEDEQQLIISRTTSLTQPEFKPFTGCVAAVVDEYDNYYLYGENEDGSYTLHMPDSMLVFNTKYKLHIETPSGELYESSYETLYYGADVDSIYYQMEEYFDKTENQDLYGAQFYVDLKAADTISRYYRWKLTETFKIRSLITSTFYYYAEGQTASIENPGDYYICWQTDPIRSIFMTNTKNLVVNEKKRIPLNYVSTETNRLRLRYSLLVSQYTLTEGAYNYWQKARNETTDIGGLYTQQPGKPVTNIYNVDDPEEPVLGYFWLSHRTEKRIFLPPVDGVPYDCELVEYDPLLHGFGPFPVFIYQDPETFVNYTAPRECLDCTLNGGTPIRPEYWVDYWEE